MEVRDQLFSSMHQAALTWLCDRAPADISRLANVPFDGTAFTLTSLGQPIRITWPTCQITPRLHPWHALTILHYLARADGTPLSGQLITFAQHRDGLIRGGGFDRQAEQLIRERLGVLPAGVRNARLHALGAELLPSNADLCARLWYLPSYPVYLKIWFADEEFPASGRMLLDSSAEHYLSIEDAVTLGDMILDLLCQEN